MFEVRCIVGDKKLPDVLRILRDHTLEPPVAIAIDRPEQAPATQISPPWAKEPIARATRKSHNGVRNRGGRARMEGGAGGVLRDYIAAKKPDSISFSEAKRAIMAKGYTHNATSYAIKALAKEGLIRKSGRGTFEVKLNG